MLLALRALFVTKYLQIPWNKFATCTERKRLKDRSSALFCLTVFKTRHSLSSVRHSAHKQTVPLPNCVKLKRGNRGYFTSIISLASTQSTYRLTPRLWGSAQWKSAFSLRLDRWKYIESDDVWVTGTNAHCWKISHFESSGVFAARDGHDN